MVFGDPDEPGHGVVDANDGQTLRRQQADQKGVHPCADHRQGAKRRERSTLLQQGPDVAAGWDQWSDTGEGDHEHEGEHRAGCQDDRRDAKGLVETHAGRK